MKQADVPNGSVKPKDAVLLIDDEKPLLDVFAAALGPYFETTLATSAREAEFILHKKAFKVVIADHLMPGGNGMNFLVRAREEYPHMQRILVTGYMKPEMLMRSVNEAALFRYLLKPVALPELIKVVQDAATAHVARVAARSTRLARGGPQRKLQGPRSKLQRRANFQTPVMGSERSFVAWAIGGSSELGALILALSSPASGRPTV